ARRLIRKGHDVVAFDQSTAMVAALASEGAVPAADLESLVEALTRPRTIWLMLPAGDATETTVQRLANLLEPDALLIDAGNTLYKDDIRRGKALRARSLRYADVGTSGGVWGLERGYCMMIGADPDIFARLDALLDSLAPGYGALERTHGRNAPDDRAERGYIHAGPIGAGHFVKMIHNGI